MEISIDQKLERILAEAVSGGQFASTEAMLDVAVRQFVIAREQGAAAADKLALLREELLRADMRITNGEASVYDSARISDLFRETEAEALGILKKRGTKQH